MNYIPDVPRTAMEVFKILPEGTRCEVIDNVLYMLPSTTITHQAVLGDIAFEIHQFVKQNNSGELFIGPCDVYLDQENVVIPDIFFIRSENAEIIKLEGISGSADLIIEVLLPENPDYDKEKKFELYQCNAIPEYIIVDATTKETWSYFLVDGKYQLQAAQQKGQLLIQQLSLTISF